MHSRHTVLVRRDALMYEDVNWRITFSTKPFGKEVQPLPYFASALVTGAKPRLEKQLIFTLRAPSCTVRFPAPFHSAEARTMWYVSSATPA